MSIGSHIQMYAQSSRVDDKPIGVRDEKLVNKAASESGTAALGSHPFSSCQSSLPLKPQLTATTVAQQQQPQKCLTLVRSQTRLPCRRIIDAGWICVP